MVSRLIITEWMRKKQENNDTGTRAFFKISEFKEYEEVYFNSLYLLPCICTGNSATTFSAIAWRERIT
jgi:hypothetical protein